MLFGILINIIFLHLFFIYYKWEKKQEQRAKLRAELRKIIDEAIANIEFNCTWEESDADTLLDWYIHEEYLWRDIDEK